jgi:ferric-dicitrate binding protein FerR (iron transport regulator)
MHSDDKIHLLQNFLNGRITDSQLRELFFWLNSEKGNLEYEKLFDEGWIKDFDAPGNIDSVKLFSKIEAKIKEKQKSKKKHFLIGLRNAAAIFVLGLILPVIYYSIYTSKKENRQVVYFKESLSNEKVKKVTLSDGTNVWLMSGSTISYPSSFAGNETRNVEVKGEAFFNVTKDSKHPFIVNLGEVGLKVIGTSFNVMNYGDEDQIQIVLETGKIDLFKGDYNSNKQFVHVNPGQLATYEKNESKFSLKETDTDKFTSWTEGILLFHDDPLDEVLKKLGRWYNVAIEIDDSSVSNFPFTATIKNENLDQIIELLQYSTPFKYSLSKADGQIILDIDKK